MRIFVLAPQPFFVQRGTPIAVRLLLETLSARGDTLDVMVFPGGEDVDIPNCRILRVPALPGMGAIGPGFSLKKLILDGIMAPCAAWRMARGRYDLVIAVEEAAFIALPLSRLFRTPYIFDVDSSIPEQMNDKRQLPTWLRRMLEGAEARVARGAIGALTCCRALEELISAHAPNLPVQTIEDIAMLEQDDGAPPPQDVDFDAPVIMYVGNLESYQGVDLLVDSMAHLTTPAHLVVIGGAEKHIQAGRARAAALCVDNKISFLGPRPLEDLGRYLRAAKIVASPRIQGRNTPMKVYSYLDSGRPLIATRLPTHTQVLDDEIAMLVEPDPVDMARGLNALLSDSALCDSLVASATERVRAEFSREGYARKLCGFIETRIEPMLTTAKAAR